MANVYTTQRRVSILSRRYGTYYAQNYQLIINCQQLHIRWQLTQLKTASMQGKAGFRFGFFGSRDIPLDRVELGLNDQNINAILSVKVQYVGGPGVWHSYSLRLSPICWQYLYCSPGASPLSSKRLHLE